MKNRVFSFLPRFSILLLFLGMVIGEAYAQSQTITGVVKDQTGEPLIGVNVMEKGTTNGSITDVDGKYSLTVNGSKAIVTFSYIGYLSQDITVGNQKMIDVTMKEDTEELEEVVVIGYGTAKKKDLTGAISTVKAENMEKETPRSVQDLLRASASGLSIGISTDAAGTANLQVRGKNTLTAGSSPLLVLDGVIYDGDLSDINPMDIQSVDVLKDASSVAVYGAKAANGVVAITTKKGKTGKPVVSFNANVGFAQPSRIPAALDGPGFIQFRKDYQEGKLTPEEMAKVPGKFTDPRQLSGLGVDPLTWYNYDQSTPVTTLPSEQEMLTTWLGRLDFKTVEIENYLNGVETNWDDIVFQTALQQDYTASISNKKEDLSYYWSLGYADREGIRVGDRFKNFRTRLNLESKVTNFLTIGLTSQFATKDKGAQAADVTQRTNNSPYTPNDIDDPDSPYRMYPSGDNNGKNPFFDNMYRDKREIEHTLNANIYAIVKLPFGIEYQMNYTPKYKWYEFMKHESAEHPEWAGKGGYAERRNSKSFNWLLDNIIRWKHQFNGGHNFEVTLLANAEKGQYWDTYVGAQNFSPSDLLGYHNMGAGTVLSFLKDEGRNQDTYRTGDALMGRLYYSYKDKYMVTASVRRDGYSAFGMMNPRATFPAVALGWVFTSEKFMEPASDWLNYGKLRFSWGQNGNRDIGQYEALAWLKSSLSPFIDQNGNIYVTSQVYVDHMGNTALKWERTGSYNIGLDFSLFNDRLRGSMETYMSETNDLLVKRSLPNITGFSDVKANLGALTNRGFELSLNGDVMSRKDFNWNSSVTFSFNRRKIKHLYGDMEDIKDENGNVIGQKEADDYKNKWFIGHDPDQIWDYEGDGVWQLGEEEEAAKYGNKPGDFKYVDQNGDGVLNDQDKVFQKYKTPRFYLSWRNEFTYKDFSLSFMMYSHIGTYGTFNPAANAIELADRRSALDIERWTVNNPTNEYGRLGSKNLGNHYVNKSFVRMENISLSYNVPKNFLKKVSVQNMRLSLSVRNPFVLSGYTFRDPEEDPDKNDLWVPRTFNVGVNFTL